MLNRLRLANFKAWREADLTFGKVTGFFGTNSAGKKQSSAPAPAAEADQERHGPQYCPRFLADRGTW